VKRVIGLPGDTLELRNNALLINGVAVEYKPLAEELLQDTAAADRTSHLYAAEQLPGQAHACRCSSAVQALPQFRSPARAREPLLHDGVITGTTALTRATMGRLSAKKLWAELLQWCSPLIGLIIGGHVWHRSFKSLAGMTGGGRAGYGSPSHMRSR